MKCYASQIIQSTIHINNKKISLERFSKSYRFKNPNWLYKVHSIKHGEINIFYLKMIWKE
ncbi:hypothetical protein CR513_24604, partial [Mucuna pruriens]